MGAQINREAIYSALFQLVATAPSITSLFTTVGRLLPHEANVPEEQCPALFTFQLPEKREYFGRGAPPKRTLFVSWVAYFAVTDSTATLPATFLNAAADAIENAITYPGNPDNVQTLGGLVEHVQILPEVRPFEGLLQDRSILVATVAMLVP